MKWKHLRDEIEAHIEEKAQDLIDSGVPEQEAWARARREFGNPTGIIESSREVWSWTWLEQLGQDLRYALRSMRNNKGFTALAVVSLGLGIGANTAIFSFMEGILLRTLPVPDSRSLVILQWRAQQELPIVHSYSGDSGQDPGVGFRADNFPFRALEFLQNNNSACTSVFGFRTRRRINLVIGDSAELVDAAFVTADFFKGIGVSPAAGRLLDSKDDQTEATATAVISFRVWQNRFGMSADAVGQTILINSRPVTIAGVAPRNFFGINPELYWDVYLPMRSISNLEETNSPFASTDVFSNDHFYWLEIMARLRDGISPEHAQVMLAPTFRQFLSGTATSDRELAELPSLMLKDGSRGLESLRREYTRPLVVLMGLVALILAVACANLANLLLARSAARRREIALRLSLGAARGRVIRQLLTESVFLASLGGAVGVLLAAAGIRFLMILLANGREGFTLHAELNWTVLSASVILSIITGLVFGMAPAIQSVRITLSGALKDRSGVHFHSRPRFSMLRMGLGQVLIVVQIALALLILVAAGLFVRTLLNYNAVELGFAREGILLFDVNARGAGYSNRPNQQSPSLVRYYENLHAQLSALPGVRSASLSEFALVSRSSGTTRAVIPGAETQPGRGGISVLKVSPGFLSTMAIPVLAGREIDARDTSASPRVAVINEVFAQRFFPGRNPVGEHFHFGRNTEGPRIEIVGVARNARYHRLDGEIPPVAYTAYRQDLAGMSGMVVELRTNGDPLSYVRSVRQAVRQIDARIPLINFRTQDVNIDRTISQEIVFARLCTAFGILALVIACVGLYATVAYNVTRRTNEIGIRIALGAERNSIVRMMLQSVIVMVFLGLGIGLPIAFGTSKLIQAFLFGIQPNDPVALTLSVGTLLTAILLASYVPARRASRIDPMIALRHE